MKIAIVGWGIEGQSVYNYFGPEHEYLIVNEHPRNDFPSQTNNLKVQFLPDEKPTGITSNVADLSYLNGIEQYEKIIYTPTAIKNLKSKFGQDQDFWAKTTCAIKIFFENSPTKNIIGITGTKGKGTTSTLIHLMLQEAGKRSYLGGNIGLSVLDFVKDLSPDDWAILELSNFQLEEFEYSPHIAVCLMITSEHMDWHPSMEDYVNAKSNIFRHQTSDDIAIYFPKNEYSTQIANLSPGVKVPYFTAPGAYIDDAGTVTIDGQQIINKSDIKLLGVHNLQNICASITAVWQVHKDVDAIKKVLSTFTGLEHRLEFVREFDGVKYYDDSFGTTPETSIVAIKSFEQPKVLILGGSDKGASYDQLAEVVADNRVKHTIVIGEIADKIVGSLKNKGFNDITTGLKTMSEIVSAAKNISAPGDVVLLSTGAASFGLFENYKDRGNQFKSCVNSLT